MAWPPRAAARRGGGCSSPFGWPPLWKASFRLLSWPFLLFSASGDQVEGGGDARGSLHLLSPHVHPYDWRGGRWSQDPSRAFGKEGARGLRRRAVEAFDQGPFFLLVVRGGTGQGQPPPSHCFSPAVPLPRPRDFLIPSHAMGFPCTCAVQTGNGRFGRFVCAVCCLSDSASGVAGGGLLLCSCRASFLAPHACLAGSFFSSLFRASH